MRLVAFLPLPAILPFFTQRRVPQIDSPDSSTLAASSTRRQKSNGASDVTPPLQDNMAVVTTTGRADG